MAALVPLWKTPLNCPVDPLTLSPLLASHSQSQQRRGEELEDTQHLIGKLPLYAFLFSPVQGGSRTAARSFSLHSE